MQWLIIFQKEVLENWRNFKWIWVVLAFVLLAIMDPLTTYYMPQILDAVGGLPEGTVIEIPDPKPFEVAMMSLGELGSLGVLVIVLISMGNISNERKSGVAEIILAKPVKYSNYVTAKWAALSLLVLLATCMAMLGSWYYINLLFGSLSFTQWLQIVCFYSLWMIFVATLSIFFNTLFRKPGIVAFSTLATVILLHLVTDILGTHLKWSPVNLSEQIGVMLNRHEITSDIMLTAVIIIFIIAALLTAAVYSLRTKEMFQ